jgi:hypothetical protein
LANPSNFERTDNNLTFSWSTNPIKELSTQLYASFRLAKYTGTQLTGGPNDFPNDDRLDFQQTYGLSVTWTPVEYVSLRAFTSFTKSDSSVNVEETGDYEAYNAVRNRVFAVVSLPPASSTVGTSALPRVGCRVEIEAVAVIPAH